jgi:hypothetical protein
MKFGKWNTRDRTRNVESFLRRSYKKCDGLLCLSETREMPSGILSCGFLDKQSIRESFNVEVILRTVCVILDDGMFRRRQTVSQ